MSLLRDSICTLQAWLGYLNCTGATLARMQIVMIYEEKRKAEQAACVGDARAPLDARAHALLNQVTPGSCIVSQWWAQSNLTLPIAHRNSVVEIYKCLQPSCD